MPHDLSGIAMTKSRTVVLSTELREASVRLTELAIADKGGDETLVDRAELRELVEMLGVQAA